MLDYGISVLQLPQIHHWHREPCAEKTGAHWRRTFIHHLDKRCPLLSCSRSKYLEIAESETVHPDEVAFIDSGNRTDIRQFLVLGLLQIDKEGTGRSNSERETVDCKTLEGIHPELPFEPFD